MGVDAMLERIEGFQSRPRRRRDRAQGRAWLYAPQRVHRPPIVRLRPTGDGDKVKVLWWNGQCWGVSGPFGVAIMLLDRALDYVANEPGFWIHA